MIDIKRKRFIEEYTVDMNASAAARRAGYSPTAGYSMLKDPEMQLELAKHIRAMTAKAEVSAEAVLRDIASVAENAMQLVPREKTMRDSEGATYTIPVTDKYGDIVYDYADRAAALKAQELLGKYLGLWVEKSEVRVDRGEWDPAQDPEEYLARALSKG